jgi:hypothetical protein
VEAGVITLAWLIVVLQLPKFIYEAHYLQNNCILHAKRTKVELAILIVLLHNHREIPLKIPDTSSSGVSNCKLR